MTLIVVAGAMANKPGNGGEAWVRLSWVRGLAQLGATVHFIEQIDPASCVDGCGKPASVDESANVAWFRQIMSQFDLSRRATLLTGGERAVGVQFERCLELAAEADLLVNISGNLSHPELMRRFRVKAYVDIDPGFTQIWHATGVADLGLGGHDLHFTIGENIGRADCPIPTAGFRWLPVRQPVVLDDWPVVEAPGDRFTTVGSWRGAFGPLEFGGRTYGLKVHEFRRFMTLPSQIPQRLELALSFDEWDAADRERLVAHGFHLADPRGAAGTPEAFRRFVQDSGGEFSVAQGVYVHMRSGWFSDRTVRYLASGKPALVQDTGFSEALPLGVGLMPFTSISEAAAAAREIASAYEEHCRAARSIAENFFDARVVLAPALSAAGVGL